VSRHDGTNRKRITYQISQYTTPETAAQKIRATFGQDRYERERREAAEELPRHGGEREQANNISLSEDHGTSETYTIRRLKRDNPERSARAGALS